MLTRGYLPAAAQVRGSWRPLPPSSKLPAFPRETSPSASQPRFRTLTTLSLPPHMPQIPQGGKVLPTVGGGVWLVSLCWGRKESFRMTSLPLGSDPPGLIPSS